MRNKEREEAACAAASYISNTITELYTGLDTKNPIGLVLGTGWGNVLKIKNKYRIPFSDIPGFSKLEKIEGHARELIIGQIDDKFVLVLSGRIHLNEAPFDPRIPEMVRLQVEMLFHLGVKNLVVTSAVGSLDNFVKVGSVVTIGSFLTLYAPVMPLWASEFYAPESAISKDLNAIAWQESQDELCNKEVCHAMVRGPFFESFTDKKLLSSVGAQVVGMSMLPEACIAAIYGVNFLGLGFVTNDMFGHSHEENLQKAKEASPLLGEYLTRIVKKI